MAGEMAGEKKTATPGIAFCVVCDRELPGYWRDDLDGCFYCREHADIQPATQAADEPRAIVRAFALLGMERKLTANEHKPGWKQDSPFDLLRRLREEVVELVDAVNDLTHVHMGQSPRTVQETTAAILLEAVDVANFALFVADVCGALPPTDERGR